ncbi:gamma-tubulin complex component 6 isoform X2 [Calliphora vicina]|uniref:gamma-tubulin complex component 6 isoform X2 n=1 Tax=Calliphora vicina TaxID=7373 RepID=UPI00325ADC8C
MHDLETNKDSVNYLINKLCLCILQQNDTLNPDQIHAAVPKLKALSYQILLKKSPRPLNKNRLEENVDFEPQRALDIQIFAAKLNSRANPEVCSKFVAFEEQLEAIKNERYFSEGAGKGILQLLLALQGNVHEEYEVPNMCAPELLVPGPFTLHANYKDNRHYPTFNDYDIMNPTPKYFKSTTPLKTTDNPYLPKFLFEGETNQLMAIENKFASKPIERDFEEDCTFTGMTKRLLGASMRININALRLFPETFKQPIKSFKLASLSPRKSVVATTAATKKEDNYINEAKKVFSWNWEGLGCFGITCSKPFAGEASISLLMQSHINQAKRKPFEAKILKLQDFLSDLKTLTVGIQSDTFYHDEFIVFAMKPNVTIEGVLPGTIEYFVEDFLECGTCYKRMQTMIMKRDYKLMFEGFMFKALCSAIDEYLLTFRQFVFAKNDTHLMSFYKRMKKMMKQITNLSFTLAIHPNVDANVKPPMGSQFLGYLYREIMRLTEKDYITLLVFILKRCCHVYFKHLQKWIFYGLLDDPCNELFVGFVDHYRENTKYFYDKAYFVRKESVPGFFQNFEEQILQCGKYTMLLKAYKPNHALFDLNYPSVSVCLSFEDIEKLDSACLHYYENAKKVCAKPITIREVFETRSEEKRQFFQRMVERSRANLERWTDEQHELALIASEQKRKRLEDLSLQLKDVKERKIRERKANVELELKYLREAEKIEEERMIKDNINLRKRIEYYQELSDIINENEKAKNKDKIKKLSLNIPPTSASSTSMQTAQLQTPASTAGTDFESCFGDDDEPGSEYEECISDDFVEKFAENEKDLRAIYEANEEDEDKDKEQLASENSTETLKNVVLEENANNVLKSCLKRSDSDFLNSNEAFSINTLQENRRKAMSGTNMDQCVKTMEVDVGNYKPIVNVKELAKCDLETQANYENLLSESKRNRMRVLNEELNFQNIHTKSMPDINLNTLPESELTDLQRNRRRMMQNDLFCEYNKDPMAARSTLYLNLDTDRARNRRKVLESEFNILTGKMEMKPVQTATGINLDTPMTPMSTTSDNTPLTETANEGQADKDNGNDVGNKTKENKETLNELKLNVSLARKLPKDLTISTAATTFVESTPDCGLNTAGIMAKKGFPFPNEEKRKKQQQDASTEAPVHNECLQQEDACPQPDYQNPYKRCCELLSTNFTCNTRSPYVRLNDPTKKAPGLENAKKLDLNIMSVITLTEFLQKSVIIPMSTHLELVNNEVMRMFLQDLKIIDHFRSLRNYYFMMDGEFGSIICDGIIGKLEDGATPEKLLNYQILHSILDTALGSSITGKDKNAENLSFIVNDVPEKFELNSPDVLNNLSLSYRINWPLNLVLNPETLEQYANIFKYLIRVRRISWILERAYQILKEAVKQHGSAILKSPQYRHVQLIRHKFYHFVHALQNHITANALQASWKTFKDELMTTKTIEDIYRKHATYIKRILFLCMLNKRSAEFYNTIENVFKISLRFYNNLKSREFKLKPGNEHFIHSRYEKLVNDELEFDKFIKYTIYLGNKIVRHGYQAEIGEFISLINYNQYYMQNAF